MAVLCVKAQQAPFSHKLHLQLKKQCTDCHAAVPASTSVTDNLLPNAAVCKPCHESRVIRAPRPTPLTHFSHAQHLKLPSFAASANACLMCHHGIDTSERVSDANMPQMADCLTCHNQIDPPFSCAQCHDPKWPGLEPANHHEPDFETKHSSKTLSKQGCALCHGKSFTCMGCHLG